MSAQEQDGHAPPDDNQAPERRNNRAQQDNGRFRPQDRQENNDDVVRQRLADIDANEAELQAFINQLPVPILNQLAQGGNFAAALLDELLGMQVPHNVDVDEQVDDEVNDEEEDENDENPDINYHNEPVINGADFEDDDEDDDEDEDEEERATTSNDASVERDDANNARQSTRGKRLHSFVGRVVAHIKRSLANGRASMSRVERKRQRINFDQTLPTEHSYLGGDMSEVRGGLRIYDDDSVVRGMPLFAAPNLILMPGQTLPLHSLHPVSVQMFRRIVEVHKVFAAVNVTHRAGAAGPELSKVGTLAQVLAYKEEEEGNISSIKLRAVGRQRFVLLDSHRQIDGTLLGDIQILPEHHATLPLNNVEALSTQRHKELITRGRRRTFSLDEPFPHNRPSSSKVSRYFACALTGQPWFAYKHWDVDYIIHELLKQLREWFTFKSEHTASLAEDATEFSYWVAANLPIGDATRTELLKVNSTVRRLQLELALMKKFSLLVCRVCNTLIGERNAVFSMSIEGPMGTYVNAGGHVHEMFTMLEINAPGVQVVGTPSTENSWFPGYAWTIAQCARCQGHLGWRFSACKMQSRPRTFWGITRHSIVPSLKSSSSSTSAENEDDERSRDGLIELLRLEE